MDPLKAAEDLERVARTKRPLEAGLPESKYLINLPRYREAGGQELLLREIDAAIASLPLELDLLNYDRDMRDDAKVLLGLEGAAEKSLTERSKAITASSNGEGRSWHQRWVFLAIANRLVEVTADDRSWESLRPYEYLSYDMRIEVDPDDHRQHTVERDLVVQINLPGQRLFGMRHYYHPYDAVPQVALQDPDQTWLDRVHTPLAQDPRWWTGVIDLGDEPSIGQSVRIQTLERYEDSREQVTRSVPYTAEVGIVSPLTKSVSLALRVPEKLIAAAKVHAKVVQAQGTHPLGARQVAIEDDGWARETFLPPDLAPGRWVGLECKGIDLHNN